MGGMTGGAPEKLPELFPDMGPSLKRSIKDGFKVLARLSQENRKRVLDDALASFNTPIFNSSTDQGELAILLGISETEMTAAKNAVIAVAMPVSSREGGLNQQTFIKAAIHEGVLLSECEEAAKEIFQLVTKQSEQVKNEIDGTQTLDDVLPLLRLFDITVDMKLKFGQSGISKIYPVAILHIDTDSYGQEIWFQVSQRQLEKIIAELKTVQDQMNHAEKAAASIRSITE